MRFIVGTVLLLLISFNGFSQGSTKFLNLPNYDDKPIHYGFHLSLNHSAFRVTHSQWFVDNDTIATLRGSGQSGFGLGFIFNFRVFKYGDVRLLPTVAFYTRTMEFGIKGEDDPVIASIQSSFVDLPILFKYKAKRRSNTRAYMVGGVKFGFEVGGKKKRDDDDELVVNTLDLSLEYGVGLDMYSQYFKFAPELRFSLGLLNMLKSTQSIYSQPVDKLSTYTVSLFLNFE